MDMRIIGVTLIIVSLVLFLFIELKKRRTFNALMNYLNRGEYDKYFSLLNSVFVRLIYPKFNQKYMELNAYLFLDDHDKIYSIFDEILCMKTNTKQRIDVISKAFNYYVERNDKKLAKKLLDEIDTYSDDNLKKECHTVYDIFILKKSHYIDEMKMRLSQTSGVDRSFLAYLISLQYENKGDKEKSKKYLEISQKDIMPQNN